MTLDDYLIDDLAPTLFEKPYFRFWINIVLESMELLDPYTDDDLKRFSHTLLDYYTTEAIPDDELISIQRDIVRLRGAAFWQDTSPAGLKYRCINAISVANKTTDPYDWQYGIVTAFQTINLDKKKDVLLIERIKQGLAKYDPDQ